MAPEMSQGLGLRAEWPWALWAETVQPAHPHLLHLPVPAAHQALYTSHYSPIGQIR